MAETSATISVTALLKSYKIGHFSDNHLGRESYRARNTGGENQRAADFARAFVNACKDIIAADPPLVINTGDVADRPHIPIRFMVLIQHWFEKIASIRPDGTRRQLVVVAGNHELPRDRREACFLDLFRGMQGVHVVTQGYQTIEFDGKDKSENCPEVLKDTVVHCLPHDALKTVDFEIVQPFENKVNILASHGVAGGSELYVRSLGREFAIPTDVLLRAWDYGALGHWHKQGPIPLVGATGVKIKDRKKNKSIVTSTITSLIPDEESETGKIWYAGSTENNGFGDLRDNGAQRGWLEVEIHPGALPTVRRKNLPIRSMFRLPHVDATGLTPDEIVSKLIKNLKKAEISSAIVGQVISNVSREIWSLVDMNKVRVAAASALHYEPDVKYLTSEKDQSVEERGMGDLADVLQERAAVLFEKDDATQALELARTFLNLALDATAAGSPKDTIENSEKTVKPNDELKEVETSDNLKEQQK